MYEEIHDKYLKISNTMGNFLEIAEEEPNPMNFMKDNLSFRSINSDPNNLDIEKLKKIMTLQQEAFEEI